MGSAAHADLGYGPSPNACLRCRADGVPLYQRPTHELGLDRTGAAERTLCAKCVGDSNRAHAEETRSAVRALKAAAVTGDSTSERDAWDWLCRLVGPVQARSIADAIRAGLAPATKGGRK